MNLNNLIDKLMTYYIFNLIDQLKEILFFFFK